MKIVRLAVPWLFAALFGFLLWKFVLPLFKPEAKKTDVQTAEVRRGDLRSSVPSDGTVIPSVLVEVKSKASGVVQKINISPGDTVKAGDVLVELDRKDVEARLREAQAGLASAQASLSLTRKSLTPQQKASLESSVRQAQNGVDEAQIGADDAQASYKRIAELHDKGYSTDAELQAAQIALDNAKKRVDSANEQLSSAQEQLKLELAGGQPEDILVAQANVQRAQAQLDNVQEELDNTTIHAPISGTVLTRPVEIGTAVASGTNGQNGGTPVCTIGDLSTMYVKAKIEEADLGRVATGLPTRITFDAYSGWLWSGTVKKVYPQGESDDSGGQGTGGGTRFPVDIAIDLKSAREDNDVTAGGWGAPPRASGGGGGRRGPRRGGGGGQHRAGTPAAPAAGGAGEAEAEGKPAEKPRLYPQMTASVEIVLEEHPDVVIVPAQFVKFDAGKAYVDVVTPPEEPKEGDKAKGAAGKLAGRGKPADENDALAKAPRERHDVELGFTDGLRYEVKSGVDEGATLILEREIKEEQR